MSSPATGTSSLFQPPVHQLAGSDKAAISLLNPQGGIQAWSWAALIRLSEHYRSTLLLYCKTGVGRLVLMAENSPAFVALVEACWQCDITCIPLSPDSAVAQVKAVVEQLHPDLAVIDQANMGRWQSVFRNANVLCLVLADKEAASMHPCTDWPRRAEVHSRHSRALLCPNGESAALVFHSSGSTGAPKAIAYSKTSLQTYLNTQGILFDCFADQTREGMSPWINVMPLVHFGGLSFCLQAIRAGRAMFLANAHQPAELARLIVSSGTEFLLMVPAQFRGILECNALLQGHHLRHCLLMGENPSSSLLQEAARLLGVRMYSAYGMSECLTGLLHKPGTMSELPAGSCGIHGFGELKLVDEYGKPSARIGELWVRNATTIPCYLNAGLNARQYVDGWYRTGDCLSCDSNGHYFYEGRMDDMVPVNGRNLYPHEVETLINQHPAVAESLAVVFRAGEEMKLGLLVVQRAGHQVSELELMDFYIPKGALFASPGCIEFCKTLPRLASGKYDRVQAGLLLAQVYAEAKHLMELQ